MKRRTIQFRRRRAHKRKGALNPLVESPPAETQERLLREHAATTPFVPRSDAEAIRRAKCFAQTVSEYGRRGAARESNGRRDRKSCLSLQSAKRSARFPKCGSVAVPKN